MDRYWRSTLRGLAILLPLMIILALAVHMARRPAGSAPGSVPAGSASGDFAPLQPEALALGDAAAPTPRPFDPNTADVFDMTAAGMTRRQAVSVIKYREAGKIYRIKEELLTVYGMTDSTYRAIEPYIRIGEQYRLRPHSYGSDTLPERSARRTRTLCLQPFSFDTLRGEHLRHMLGFTLRQAEAFDAYIRRRGAIDSYESMRECYLLDIWADTLAPYAAYSAPRPADTFTVPVELNGADSAALRRIYGIGEKSVTAIMERRRRLGGFCRAEQLAEIKEVTESNYEKILQQICIDTCKIQKIDVNFATPEILGAHPYITPRILRRLLKQRQLKGGWSAIEEMTEQGILTDGEAERLAPYLRFDTSTRD